MSEDKKCYVCEGTEPKDRWFAPRCEEHDVCNVCKIKRKDLKDSPWGQREGWVCKPCMNKKIQAQVDAFQAKMKEEGREELYSDNGIICPNCGHENEQDNEDNVFYEDGEHDYTCGNCEHEFKVITDVIFSYTTQLDGTD